MKVRIYDEALGNGFGYTFPGGTLTGSLLLADDPEKPLEASTKRYVDSVLSALDASNLTSGTIPVGRLPALSGDALSLAGTNVLNLATSTVTPGSYANITVNEKGIVIGGGNLPESSVPYLDWSKISSGKPTTLGGYGITDGVRLIGNTMTGYLTLHSNPTSPLHAATKSYIDSSVSDTTGLVVGDIIRKPYSTTPAGFLKCNGATVSKSTYMALYSVLSDTFTDYLSPNNGTPWQEQYYINETQNADIVGWGTGVALPVTLASSHAVVTKNRVYLIGGKTAAGATSSAVYTAPINSDGSLGAWTTSAALPLAVSGSRAVVTKNRVFLLGGYDASGVKLASVLTAAVNSDGTLGAWANTKQLQTSALSGSGSMTIPSGVISVAITGKGGTGTTTYHPEVPYVAPTGNASYPSGLPVYNAGQAYIAPTGNASYPSGLPVYVADLPYISAKTSSLASGSRSLTLGSSRVTSLSVSMVGGVGTPGVVLKGLSMGNAITADGVVYNGNTILFTYPGGRTYVGFDQLSGIALSSSGQLLNTAGVIQTYPTQYTYGGINSNRDVITSNGKILDVSGMIVATLPSQYTYVGLDTGRNALTSDGRVYNSSGTLVKQIYNSYGGTFCGFQDIAANYAYLTSTGYVYSYTGSTGNIMFPKAMPILGESSTFTINGETYTFPGTDGSSPPAYITKTISLPGTSLLTASYTNSGSSNGSVTEAAVAAVAGQGNASYPSGLPVYNAGQPYVAPTGNASYPSGLPVYNPGQAYAAAYNSYTTGAATTLTMNGQTYTFPGGYGGEAAQSTQTAALPGTSTVNTTYSVASGGSCSLSFNIDGGIANIVGDLPSAIAQEQAVLTTNKLYTLGGVDTSAVYAATVNSDGTLAAWSTATSLPVATSAAALVVTSNRVYVAGGIISGNPSAAVHTAFINTDGTLGAWSAAASLPVAISNAQVMVSKKRVYLFGGKVGGVASSAVYTAPINADGTLGAWTTQSSLSTTIYDSQAIVTANKVHLLGGVISNAYSSVTYKATITGGLNDYSTYYDGSTTPIVSTEFQLPDTTAIDGVSNVYHYIKV